MFEPDAYTTIINSNGNGLAYLNPHGFRWNAISSVSLSGIEYQAIIFQNQSNYLVVGTRQAGGAWTFYTTTISITPDDNHKVSVMGIDPDGYIHIDYGHPGGGSALNYRKSNNPINTFNGAFTAILSMLGGVPETNVIYPEFIADPAGNLYFLFITEAYGFDGKLYMYKYNHATTTWSAAAGTSTAGLLIDAIAVGNRALYHNMAAFDLNFGGGGYFHLSWCWQWDNANSNGRYNPSYAKWDGTTWEKSDGTSQTVPITTGNSETIESVAINTGLHCKGSTASDSNGHPHVVYNRWGADNYLHAYHAWHNGSAWTVTQITSTENDPETDGSYPYTLPNPTIAINGTTAYIIYLNSLEGDGLFVAKSDDPFTVWAKTNIYPVANLLPWRPKYDPYTWANHHQLDILVENWFGATPIPGSGGPYPIRTLEYVPFTPSGVGPHLKSGASFLKSGASFLTN